MVVRIGCKAAEVSSGAIRLMRAPLGSSDDGSHVYFVAKGVLTERTRHMRKHRDEEREVEHEGTGALRRIR